MEQVQPAAIVPMQKLKKSAPTCPSTCCLQMAEHDPKPREPGSGTEKKVRQRGRQNWAGDRGARIHSSPERQDLRPATEPG